MNPFHDLNDPSNSMDENLWLFLNSHNILFCESSHLKIIGIEAHCCLGQCLINHVRWHGIHYFFLCLKKNIAIEKNIFVDVELPTNCMNMIPELKEKNEQFKTLTTTNIVKHDTFRSVTTYLKYYTGTKLALYSWSDSNFKIW